MFTILFEDHDLIVAIKPPALVSESTTSGDGFADKIAEHCSQDYVGVVHRLDRGVGGVMVYAKNKSAAAALSRAIIDRSFEKEYLAVVHGNVTPDEGEYVDLLFHDRAKNKTFVTDRVRGGVKEARLTYRVIEERASSAGDISLVSVRLLTGRTHQIRVQFSSRRHPLVGDRKYGAPAGAHGIRLFCRQIAFPHPKDGRRLCFSAEPEQVCEEFLML